MLRLLYHFKFTGNECLYFSYFLLSFWGKTNVFWYAGMQAYLKWEVFSFFPVCLLLASLIDSFDTVST